MNNLKRICFFTLLFLLCVVAFPQANKLTYRLVKTITGKLSPKSICNNGHDMFFAQNMMYQHSITVYDSNFNLVSTISDKVTPSTYGFNDIKGFLIGAPVESATTKDGKYLWVSNYNMSGTGFTNPGCDSCCGKGYDNSFVYKVNTQDYKIENIVKVGSVPKYLAITSDQKKLIVSNWSSRDVSIIDLGTEKEIKRVNVGNAPRGIVCDSTSSFAYIAVMGADKIVSIDLNTYTTEILASGLMNPRHLCICKNYLYASLNGEQTVCRINLTDKKLTKLFVGRAPRSMVLSSIENKLYVDCYKDGKIAVIDLNDFKLETDINTNPYPIGICLSKDNRQIWVSCYTGSIQVFAEEGTKRTIPQTLATVQPKKTDNTPVQIGYPSAIDNNVAWNTPLQKNESDCYIVLGSFSIKQNALLLKNRLLKQGIKVEIIDSKRGYTYCACKTEDNTEASEKMIMQIEALTGIKGWLYKV